MEEITWAPRVAPDKIRRLYRGEAEGRLDEALLQDVGYAFAARAQSVVDANRIHLQHTAICPRCRADIPLKADAYACACGWHIAAKALHQTYKGKQLIGPSIVGFAEGFIRDWNRAMDDSARQMLAIDFLIHRFHWEMTDAPSRPVAINYIQGSMTQIEALILQLACAPTEERQENRAAWLRSKAASERAWGERVEG